MAHVAVGDEATMAIASGVHCIAVGEGAQALAYCSIAIGKGAIARRPFEVAFTGWDTIKTWEPRHEDFEMEQVSIGAQLIDNLQRTRAKHVAENTTGSYHQALELIDELLSRVGPNTVAFVPK